MSGRRVSLLAVFFLGCLAVAVGPIRAAAPSLLVDLDPAGGTGEVESEISGPYFSLGPSGRLASVADTGAF